MLHNGELQAGTTNPTVELFMVELDGSDNPSRMKLEPPVSIVSSDHILGTVFWINDEQVGAIWLNRRQDQAVLVSYDTTTPTASHPGRIVSISTSILFVFFSPFLEYEENTIDIKHHNARHCLEFTDLEWQIFTTNR